MSGEKPVDSDRPKVGVRVGALYHLRNHYRGHDATYLDSCGRAAGGVNVYDVSTSNMLDRAGKGTGIWKIIFAGDARPDGDPVCIGDLIHLENQYKNRTYLDTYGKAAVGSNVYGVSTSSTPDRAKGTGTWKIVSGLRDPAREGSELSTGDLIHLENQYGIPTYLDTCGKAQSGENAYDVSTSKQADRAGEGTGTWSFVPCEIIKWKALIEAIEFKDPDHHIQQARGDEPELIQAKEYYNQGATTLHDTVTLEHTKTSSFEFSLSQTLAAGVSATVKASVPGVEASLTASINLTLAAGQRWTNTEGVRYSVTTTVDVPPGANVRVTAQMDWVSDVTIPVTYLVWVSGRYLDMDEELNGDQLEHELTLTGFTGRVRQKQQDRLLVALEGTLRGSWGVNSRIETANI